LLRCAQGADPTVAQSERGYAGASTVRNREQSSALSRPSPLFCIRSSVAVALVRCVRQIDMRDEQQAVPHAPTQVTLFVRLSVDADNVCDRDVLRMIVDHFVV
jgi:hypothetical protein